MNHHPLSRPSHGPRRGRFPLRAVVLAAAAVLVALPLGASAPDESADLVTRTFEVRHKSFEDAVLVVTEIVAQEGTDRNELRIQRQLKRITVTDIAAVVREIAQALEAFDVPPRQVRVTMTLMLGSRGTARAEEEPVDDVYHSVVSELRKALAFTDYRILGSLTVPGIEGAKEPSTATLQGYTIEFLVNKVVPGQRLVQLRPLELSRRGSGGQADEKLFSTTLNLTAGQQMVMGLSSDPSAERGLFLAVTASPID